MASLGQVSAQAGITSPSLNLALLLLGVHLASSNPLDAEVTFFRDSFSPLVDVRIQSFFVFFRPGGRIPVEITDRVRTIGDAHPNTDAPGIDLSHNSFRVLVGGRDGADLCAGRSVAMHAGHGNEAHLYIRDRFL